VVFATDDLLRRALAMYNDYADKTSGLVDCASFIVMKDEGIDAAFTNDRHFKQAGFRCLLPIA
jgi:predicted nucleic acid-binding protein